MRIFLPTEEEEEAGENYVVKEDMKLVQGTQQTQTQCYWLFIVPSTHVF
jgi:hypothetical protein